VFLALAKVDSFEEAIAMGCISDMCVWAYYTIFWYCSLAL
jgi:hypothetical protein